MELGRTIDPQFVVKLVGEDVVLTGLPSRVREYMEELDVLPRCTPILGVHFCGVDVLPRCTPELGVHFCGVDVLHMYSKCTPNVLILNIVIIYSN